MGNIFASCWESDEDEQEIDKEATPLLRQRNQDLSRTRDDSTVAVVEMSGSRDDSTVAVVETLVPFLLPIIRKAVSKQLVENGLILRNEEPVKEFVADKMDDFPIGNIDLDVDDVVVVDTESLRQDMSETPEFEWPEKESYEDLMKEKPGNGRRMLVLDFIDLCVHIPLGEGIELAFPVKLPLAKNFSHLEIGCGGDIANASVALKVPRLRVWFLSKSMKLYVAFLARPDLIPNLHINLDRGKGDFMNTTFTENGALDDIVESVLAGFGPKSFVRKKNSEENRLSLKERAGDKVGRAISKVLKKVVGVGGGNKRPLEIDLSEAIQSGIDVAMGIPRPLALIQANLALLQKELAMAMLAEEAKKKEEGGIV